MQDPEKEKELNRFKKGLLWLNRLFVFLADLLSRMHRKAMESLKKIDE